MAVVERGELKIAISTEGASPTLARKIKRDLIEVFDDGYEDYLRFLLKARKKIKETVHDEERKNYLLNEIMYDFYRKNEVERERFLENIN